MRTLARAAVANPVAVNLLALALVVGGLFYYRTLPREIFPDFSLGQVQVVTRWPLASPEDMERLVTVHVEDAAFGLEGVKEILSSTQEGYSQVTVTLESGTDVDRFLNDLRDELANVDDFPEEVENRYRPQARELRNQFPVITLSIFGAVSEHELRRMAQSIQEDLRGIDGVVTVGVSGLRDPEIWIEVEPSILEAHGLTPEGLAAIVSGKNVDAPLATMPTTRGDLLVRLAGRIDHTVELLDLPVVSDAEGQKLTLRDLGARVSDRFERARTLGRYNGHAAMTFVITKDRASDAIRIADAVRTYAEQLRAGELMAVPEGVSVGVSSDFSVFIRNRLETMETSGIIGLTVVVVMLCLFLDVRVALMTALGLPVALLGALILCAFFGITMNMMTMFAVILVLGMLVDDAIVVAENVYRHIEEGMEPHRAAVQGLSEVALPVMATVATTLAAFLPMMLMEGTMARFLHTIPQVVSFALLISLLEALVILPSHLAEIAPRRVHPGPQVSERRGPVAWVAERYARLVAICLRWRYVTAALAFACLLALFAMLGSHIPFTLFDEIETKLFFVDLEVSASSSLEDTQDVARLYERAVMELPDEELLSATTTTGLIFLDTNRFESGSHKAQINVELREGRDRERTTNEIIESLRARTAGIAPETRKVQFRKLDGGPVGAAIEVGVRGKDLRVLETIADEMQAFLREQPGVRDVRTDLEPGKTELSISLTDEGRALGFDERGVATALRGALEGAEASRVRRGRDDVDILVRYPERYQRNTETLRTARLQTPDGGAHVPLSRIARIEERIGAARIQRDDRERSITVLADVVQGEGNASQIAERLAGAFVDLPQRHPGYSLAFKGDKKEWEDSVRSLVPVTMLALFLIYFILGALFRSYVQPFLVMLIIPFAVGGVLLGFLVMGKPISFLAVMGILALCGIVVNDSLVLMDFVNRSRREGMPIDEALVHSGRMRFRAILLTSITTVAGLSPLAFFSSGQARFLAPMAQAIVFGLTASTVLVLIVLPCLARIWEDLRTLPGRLRRRGS